MMAQILESILSSLMQPDNVVIQQATAQLKEAFKDPAVLLALCEVLTGSQNPQIRQFAAVLVRRRLTKTWKKLNPELRENLKSLVLDAIQREPEHKVRHALAQLASVMLKNETLDKWPQIFQYMQQMSRSNVPEQRQVGLLVLSTALDSCTKAFQPHFRDLLRLFHHTLEDTENKLVLFYTIQAITVMAQYMGKEEMNQMRSLIPKIIAAIQELIRGDETQASEAMEVFDELMECEASIIAQHLTEIVTFCLQIAAKNELGDALRVKALSCISFLIKLKGKSILKHKLLPQILNTLFPIMCAEPPAGEMDPEDDEDDAELEGDAEVQSPKQFSVQVIDMLALHLPPEKLFPQLSPLMEPALLSGNPYQRKAALMCLAVISEGCADHIRHKHLQPMLHLVCQALGDDTVVVRNAALFALGQFSENLQPDIIKFSDEIMPLLLNYLAVLEQSRSGHLPKAYYALENFVENLGPKIAPYLPTLMERILNTLRSPDGTHRAKELSVSAIGAIANAAEDLLLPYFPALIEHLKGYLVNTQDELRPIQIQSLETLGILARNLGKDVFLPLSEECCQLGLNLCNQVDDPDLRRCTYSLFAALSLIMEDGIASHLEHITTLMVLSLKSREGVVPHYSENKTFTLFEDEDETPAEEETTIDEDEDPDIEGYSVENAYIDEKEDACMALGEIALHASSAFMPYLDQCFVEVFKHMQAPHMNVRKAVYEALCNFCRGVYRVWQKNPSEQNAAALEKMLSVVFPAYFKAVREDKERLVVMSILESMNDMLKEGKGDIVREAGRLSEICNVIREVLQKKTACQDPDAEDTQDDEEQQAEFDAMLVEYAGEGIPLVGAAVGGEAFAPFFAGFLPLLLSKTKPNNSLAEKSFAIGTIAETVQQLGTSCAQFLPRLFPVMLSGAKEEDEEVRSNAIFGLGVLVEQGKEAAYDQYPKVLTLLSAAIAREQNARTMDNICGAVARMIITNAEGVPIDQVLPVMLRAMPLKDDLAENVTVFKCITFLYSKSPEKVIKHLGDIVRISGQVLGTNDLKPETQETLILLLKDVAQRFPQDLQNAMMSLTQEAVGKVNLALSN